MDDRTSVELAERCLQALDDFDIDAVAALFASDAIWRDPRSAVIPGERRGRGAIARLVIDLAQLTAGTFRRRVQDIFGSGDRAVVVSMVSAKVGASEVTWGEMLIFHSDGSRITEVWAFPADAGSVAELRVAADELELQATG